MSCPYCCDGEAKCARDRCTTCCSCGRDLTTAILPSIGAETLFFNLPASAGLPGRGVLVEWGEGRVTAGLDAGPFVELPTSGAPTAPSGGTKPDALWRVVYRDAAGRRCTSFVATDSADVVRMLARTTVSIQKIDPVTGWAIGDERAAVTIEAAPPEDLLDRITPEPACGHTRRSLRPDPQGNPVTTCIDCGDEIP